MGLWRRFNRWFKLPTEVDSCVLAVTESTAKWVDLGKQLHKEHRYLCDPYIKSTDSVLDRDLKNKAKYKVLVKVRYGLFKVGYKQVTYIKCHPEDLWHFARIHHIGYKESKKIIYL